MMRNSSFVSALIYVSTSLIASGAFFILTLPGSHTWVTRIGGAAWVFLLSMIILMPTVIPLVKRRLGRK